MEKSRLERFIAKYNLGGGCETVVFISDGNTLRTRAISPERHVLCEVSAERTNFPQGEFGVFDTKKLRAILNVLDDSVDVKIATVNSLPTGINFKDANTKATFVLADVSVVPEVPTLKKLPPMEFTLTLDEKFINTFVKAKSALSDATSFAVMSDGETNTASVVIGYSNNNTNRISIDATTDVAAKLAPVKFSANYLREIFTANKEIKTGTLQVSSKGMAIAEFAGDGYVTRYMLVDTDVE